MQTSVYNNPLFAQGLAGIVRSFIGDPQQTMREMELQMQVDDRNRERAARQRFETSLEGSNLSGVMREALLAGPQYANAYASMMRAQRSGGGSAKSRDPLGIL